MKKLTLDAIEHSLTKAGMSHELPRVLSALEEKAGTSDRKKLERKLQIVRLHFKFGNNGAAEVLLSCLGAGVGVVQVSGFTDKDINKREMGNEFTIGERVSLSVGDELARRRKKEIKTVILEPGVGFSYLVGKEEVVLEENLKRS